MAGVLLADVAATSAGLTATRSRLAKRALLVDLLRRTGPDEVPVVARYLGGELRQRRTGLGWRSLATLPEPADEPTLGVLDVDAAFERMSHLAGPGSSTARTALAAELFATATEPEQALLRGLVAGDLLQGSPDALLLDAVAEAAGVPAEAVRRAAMLAGSTEPVATAALGASTPDEASRRSVLSVSRPVDPCGPCSRPAHRTCRALPRRSPGGPSSWTPSSTASASRCDLWRQRSEINPSPQTVVGNGELPTHPATARSKSRQSA
jgi:DNA ligase-1